MFKVAKAAAILRNAAVGVAIIVREGEQIAVLGIMKADSPVKPQMSATFKSV